MTLAQQGPNVLLTCQEHICSHHPSTADSKICAVPSLTQARKPPWWELIVWSLQPALHRALSAPFVLPPDLPDPGTISGSFYFFKDSVKMDQAVLSFPPSSLFPACRNAHCSTSKESKHRSSLATDNTALNLTMLFTEQSHAGKQPLERQLP